MQAILAAAEELAHLGSWVIDLRTRRVSASDEMFRIHGLEPGAEEPSVELLLRFVHPDDRPRISALIDGVVDHPEDVDADGISGDYRAVLDDGSVREIRFHGRVERNGGGRPAFWLGAAQDVTEERLTERELRAHYAVSQALHDWESFDESVIGLLRRLGTALDFPLGLLWLWDDERSRIFCRAVWAAPGRDADTFEAVARDATFAPGEGVPGVVWQTEQPMITPDLAADPVFTRGALAAQFGLQSGLAFPALSDDGPIAVLSFYGFDRRVTSDRLVRTLTGIGSELGRFLRPRAAQLQARTLSDRELEVLRLAAEGNSGPEIAERLVVSPSTVKTHFENIYEKLGVGERAAAVAYALRTGLID